MQTVPLLADRDVPSPVSACQSRSVTAATVLAVSGCVNLGSTIAAALFVAPAHPEIAP
jgi:hypothetical protein